LLQTEKQNALAHQQSLGLGLLYAEPLLGHRQGVVQTVAYGLEEIPGVLNALSGKTVLKVRHRGTAPAQGVGYDTTADGEFRLDLFLELNKEVYF